MRKAIALMMVSLLLVFHAPPSAQALSSFLTDYLPFGTSEPAMLFLTGMTLLSLSRLGSRQ